MRSCDVLQGLYRALGERRNIKNNGVHIGAISHERNPDLRTEKENMKTDASVGILIGEVSGLIADLMGKLAGEKGREWLEAFKLFLKKQNPWPEVVKTVAGVKSLLSDMVVDCHFDSVNEHVNEKNFPPETLVLGSGPKIFHFNRRISSEDVIAEMKKDGYRPAKLGDLLDYGAKNPEEQRKYPIVALGSAAVILAVRYVACIYGDGSERELVLSYFVNTWDAHSRFLAVRI